MWFDFFKIFTEIVNEIMTGLNNAMISDDFGVGIDLTTIDLNILLLSETPIVFITLYDLLSLVILGLLLAWFIKILLSLITVPIKVMQRYLNRLG